jgi:hypothetical protein
MQESADQNPKSEGRNPKEIRRPKCENRPLAPINPKTCNKLERHRFFLLGVRISAFIRISDFGLRFFS